MKIPIRRMISVYMWAFYLKNDYFDINGLHMGSGTTESWPLRFRRLFEGVFQAILDG